MQEVLLLYDGLFIPMMIGKEKGNGGFLMEIVVSLYLNV
jgi:hypothetical protein